MIAMGGYIVAQPGLYRAEVRKLLPRRSAERVEMTARHIALSLKLWCIGQAIQMLLVGALTALAVWLIGLPSPLALGVIAGLAEFIPYVGPLIAAIPALLVATSQGWSLLAWTALAYVAIQQIEGNLLLPMIQRRLVAIPPAGMLFGILAVGAFFGLQGVVFAAPITVMVYAAIENQASGNAAGACVCQ
jgi:predicted PurR-regulated permease PerM